MVICIESEQVNDDIYESKFGKTMPGNIRGLAMFETYKTEIFLDDSNNILGIKSDKINQGNLIGTETSKKINNIGIGNVVKFIIEQNEYENVSELLKEINVAYKFKLEKILLDENEYKKKYLIFDR